MKKLKLPLVLAALMVSGITVAQKQDSTRERKIDEVVLIGYGSTKKKDATGALNSVKAEDFNKGVNVSPEQLLQGKAAGVQVTSTSGDPNGKNAVRIRGFSSIRSGTDPLYVIDGVPLASGDTSAGRNDTTGFGSNSAGNPMNFINSADIESIDILKDASATAIYGARGANGVILITTKKGRKGAGQLTFNANAGISHISREYNLLGAEEFAANTTAANNFGAKVDAFKEIIRSGSNQQYDLAYAGGTDGGSYRVSLSFFNQEGIIKNSENSRTTVAYMVSQKFFNNKLNLESSVNTSFIRSLGAPMADNIGAEGDLMMSALRWNPTRSFYDPSSPSGFTRVSNNQRNPLDLLAHYTDIGKTFRTVGNLGATLTLAKGLDYKATLGIDYSNSNRGIGMSSLIYLQDITDKGVASQSLINKFSYLTEHTLNYNANLSSALKLNALLGYSFQKFNENAQNIVVSNFAPMTDQNFYIDHIFSGTSQNASGQGLFAQSSYNLPTVKLQSFFGRAIFTYDDKYTINGVLRYDGSSKFGANNKYGFFPGISASWNIAKETFAPSLFNVLKLRGGWGITGNQDFPAASSITYLQPLSGNWRPVNYGNPDLKWESTAQTNIGLDFALLHNRLSGSLDIYNKETKNILMQNYQLQRPTDKPYGWYNLKNSRINTKGLELVLAYKLIQEEDYNLEIGGNISYNTSKITGVNADGFDPTTGIITANISGQGLSGEYAQGHFEGEELYQFNLLQFEGFDSNGMSLYKTADGGVTSDVGKAVKMKSGSALPNYNVGLNLKGNYKNWDLFVNGYGQYGGLVYDNTSNALFYKAALATGNNITVETLQTSEAKTGNSNSASTRFLHSSDFFRLANLSIGYTMKGEGGIFQYVRSIRFSITGQNLFIITPYKGFDPEVSTNKTRDGVPSFGMDYAAYPRSTSYLFGMNVNF